MDEANSSQSDLFQSLHLFPKGELRAQSTANNCEPIGLYGLQEHHTPSEDQHQPQAGAEGPER